MVLSLLCPSSHPHAPRLHPMEPRPRRGDAGGGCSSPAHAAGLPPAAGAEMRSRYRPGTSCAQDLGASHPRAVPRGQPRSEAAGRGAEGAGSLRSPPHRSRNCGQLPRFITDVLFGGNEADRWCLTGSGARAVRAVMCSRGASPRAVPSSRLGRTRAAGAAGAGMRARTPTATAGLGDPPQGTGHRPRVRAAPLQSCPPLPLHPPQG